MQLHNTGVTTGPGKIALLRGVAPRPSAFWESPDFNGLTDALIMREGCLWL